MKRLALLFSSGSWVKARCSRSDGDMGSVSPGTDDQREDWLKSSDVHLDVK